MHSTTVRIRQTAEAANEPLSLSDAKLYCRVDTAADDAAITSLIKAARRRVEKDTGLALMTQTFVAVLDQWPGSHGSGLSGPWWDGVRDGSLSQVFGQAGVIQIPKRPFQAVTQIQLRDAYGAYTTVDPSIYFTEVSDYHGQVIRKIGQVWPIVILAPSGAIEITFTAGFDAAPYNVVPEDLVHAIKFLIKHWYDNRELVMDGRTSAVPHGYQDIIASWRPMRLR